MTQQIINNARLVLKGEVISGSLSICDGSIVDIDHSLSQHPAAIDWQGDFLLPGMVELHTDNMEKYFAPRPGVKWPSLSAIMAHDTQMAASGVTTVFNAVAVGYDVYKSYRTEILDDVIESINHIHQQGIARAHHFLHLRCELSCDATAVEFDKFSDHPLLRLVSLMDHSPGQRQFSRIDKYTEYYQNKYGFTDDEMAQSMERHRQASELWSDNHRDYIARRCLEKKIPMASHDDANSGHIEEACKYQIGISEFPTTLEAAHDAHQHNLKVLMGAPNLIRGYSHSGNIAAQELAEQGLLDILSSDYYPASLLHSAFKLSQLDMGYDLPAAVRCVSLHPAEAAGLDDRGSIAIGKKADILRVKLHQDTPLLQETWCQGRRVN